MTQAISSFDLKHHTITQNKFSPLLYWWCFFLIIVDFWNNSDTESEVDLQLSTGGFDQDDDEDFDFYG